MKQLILLLNLISAISAYSQTARIGDSIEISFMPVVNGIVDSAHHHLSIIFINISHRPILVYKELNHAYPQSRFGNVYASVEKKIVGTYTRLPTPFYRLSDEALRDKAYRHFDPPKVVLGPSLSDTLLFDLRDLALEFDSGYYRINLNLRINTVLDTTATGPDSSAYYPDPSNDKVEYLSSDWIYFVIKKQIWFNKTRR
jgi:hypothetical protein